MRRVLLGAVSIKPQHLPSISALKDIVQWPARGLLQCVKRRFIERQEAALPCFEY